MIYRLQIGPWNITLSAELYQQLNEAIEEHESRGFRDGETRVGRVTITECGASA